MSSIPPLRCLFCKHLNPADAIFCNECGRQLNLQPCNRCGAVDDRAARNCHKCGAEFTPPAAPGLDSLPAPAILDKEVTYPTLNDAKAALPEATHPNHDLTHSPPEPQPVDETVSSEMDATSLLWRKRQDGWVDETLSSEMDATATKSRRRRFVAIAALLLMLTIYAVSVYFYSGQPEQLAQEEGEKQAVPDVSGAPKPGASTPSTVAAQPDSDSKPADTVPKPATATDGLENSPSLAPPGAGAAPAERPLSATDAEVKTRQDPPIFEECPQAVATLGLCNPNTQQRKQ